MENGFEIRKIDSDLLETALKTVVACFMPIAEEKGLEKSTCLDFPAFSDLKRLRFELENGVLMYGLFDEGQKMCGFFGLDVREREVILTKICVLPDLQHNGLGSEMLSTAKEQTQNQGLPLTVVLDSSDKTLAEWFTKRGFDAFEEREIPTYPYDVIKLKCLLSEGEGS